MRRVIDMLWQNFLTPEFRTKFQRGSTLITGDKRISFQHSVGRVEGSSRAKKPARFIQPFR